MRTSAKGRRFITQWEGCELTAYQDIVGVWTIGVGHTGPDVHEGQTITKAEADRLLAADLRKAEAVIPKDCTQAQFDAMVSLAFNVGNSAFSKSTLKKLHDKGDYAGAAAQFKRWNKAGGKVVGGLTKRRLAEAQMYLSDVEMEEVALPAAEAPSNPVMRWGIASGGLGGLGMAADAAREVSTIRDSLGDWMLPAALLVALGAIVALAIALWKAKND